MTERVNHPPHYQTVPGIECIDVVRHFNFNRGNAIKYIWRAGSKDSSTEVEDLRKALWYIRDEILQLTGGDVEQHPLVERLRRDLDAMTADRDFYREQVFAAAERTEPEQSMKIADESEPVVVPAPWRWEDAPEWAQWWAVDQNGTAWWFSDEPSCLLSWGVWRVNNIRGARSQPVHPETLTNPLNYNPEHRVSLGDYPWFNTKRMRGDYGV